MKPLAKRAPLDVLAAGEGIETTLSLKRVLPTMPMVAALSASNLHHSLPDLPCAGTTFDGGQTVMMGNAPPHRPTWRT